MSIKGPESYADRLAQCEAYRKRIVDEYDYFNRCLNALLTTTSLLLIPYIAIIVEQEKDATLIGLRRWSSAIAATGLVITGVYICGLIAAKNAGKRYRKDYDDKVTPAEQIHSPPVQNDFRWRRLGAVCDWGTPSVLVLVWAGCLSYSLFNSMR